MSSPNSSENPSPLFSLNLASILATVLSGTYLRPKQQDRSLIRAGLLLVSGALLATPLVSGLNNLCIVQAIHGIGVGLAFPLPMSPAIQPFPMEQQGTAMGFSVFCQL